MRVSIEQANASDRDAIARLRHQVYALEIHQHHSNGQQRLTDDLDAWNTYLVARDGDTIAGFVSITPPTAPRFSIDKYFSRTALPVAVDARTYEVRLLTSAAHSGSNWRLIDAFAQVAKAPRDEPEIHRRVGAVSGRQSLKRPRDRPPNLRKGDISTAR